jgi:nicotinate-nucleotide pyrophosphorylase (carboxylating)
MTGPSLTPRPASASVPVPSDLAAHVASALAEDIGSGDRTAALIPKDKLGRATVITREATIVCGIPYVEAVFRQVDASVRFDWKVIEGAAAHADQVLFIVEGPARALLTAERSALNFLQLLSGTASATHEYASRIAGTQCQLLDTRKTIPGLRTAQKYAVRVGGGRNHRIGLFDGILLKENHIMAAGSITAAVTAAKKNATVPVEVEVESLAELKEAIDAHADIALLDNFSIPLLREGVALNSASSPRLKLEASGGVSLETIAAIAATGVDFVSVGSITKHVHAPDLSMRFEWS